MLKRDGGIPLPPHAYIPGLNARHPEDWFDGIKARVTPDVPLEKLHHTAAWQAGLSYFDAGYFWECHEVLEAVWMRTPVGSIEREFVQAIIQLANARLKLLMERPRAAKRLCAMVDDHLSRCGTDGPIFGLPVPEVQEWLSETRRRLGDGYL